MEHHDFYLEQLKDIAHSNVVFQKLTCKKICWIEHYKLLIEEK